MNLKYKFIKAQTLNQSSIATITTLQARHTTNQPNLKVEKKPNERIFQKPKSHLSLSLTELIIIHRFYSLSSLPIKILQPLLTFNNIYIFLFTNEKAFPDFVFPAEVVFLVILKLFLTVSHTRILLLLLGSFQVGLFFSFFKFKNQLVFVCVWLLSQDSVVQKEFVFLA